MPTNSDILWFKQQFSADIDRALVGTPFDLDMLTALACQETGEIWPNLPRKGMSRADILTLCVGDVIDGNGVKGRSAFPINRAQLLTHPKGQAMFDIARKALVDMAVHIKGYQSSAAKPHKFCRGFGLFQYDLQFFKNTDPDYFLLKKYEKLDATLGKCLGELKNKLQKFEFKDKAKLSDLEFAFLAIAYNTGRFKPQLGLKQGFKPSGGKFYGEQVFEFIRMSRTVAIAGQPAEIAPPPSGVSIVPPPEPVTATGSQFIVDTKDSPLRVRSEPIESQPSNKNVIARLPDGQAVRAVTGTSQNGFLEIETGLFGALIRGFVSEQFLVPITRVNRTADTAVELTNLAVTADPPAVLAAVSIPSVTMPRKAGTVTTRAGVANAHSLNEPGQPSRKGTTPSALVAELSTIIDWLAVESPDHSRYKRTVKQTFCNIYAHDYCILAGIYLPRVWWTSKALIKIAAGEDVSPLIEKTITELRANDLFRWLRDFGSNFEWRQTGTTTKLQQAANEGGIGLIVARRKDDDRSGHIVVVVPENATHSARRNAQGDVTHPLQSQAGATNFRRGTSTLNWWRGEQFAESAFWIHG